MIVKKSIMMKITINISELYKFNFDIFFLNKIVMFERLNDDSIINILSYLENTIYVTSINKLLYSYRKHIKYHLKEFYKSRITYEELSKLTYLKGLFLDYNDYSFQEIPNFNLLYLSLHKNDIIRNISHLSSLISLTLSENDLICENQLINMQNLKYLDLKNNKVISSNIFKYLPNLKTLLIKKWYGTCYLDSNFDNNIKHLSGLTYLCSDANRMITDDNFKYLTSLKKLKLRGFHDLTDNAFLNLTNILDFELHCVIKIDGSCFKYLINLERLSLWYNVFISDDKLINNNKLKILKLNHDLIITGSCFNYFPDLKELVINHCKRIKDSNVSNLCNLETFKYEYNDHYEKIDDIYDPITDPLSYYCNYPRYQYYDDSMMDHGEYYNTDFYRLEYFDNIDDIEYNITPDTFKNMNLTNIIIPREYICNTMILHMKNMSKLKYIVCNDKKNKIRSMFPNIIVYSQNMIIKSKLLIY